MSRINVEDKLWSDARFDALKNILGSELMAIGMVVKSFRIAQEFWKTETQLVPFEIWDLYNFSAMEKVGLVERCDLGVYIKGSSDQFDWLKKKQAAGKKSAEIRREKFGSAQPNSEHSPNTSRTPPEHLFENPRTPPEPPTPTPTPTPTLNTNTSPAHADAKPKKPKKESIGTNEVIAKYCELFKQRYGIDTAITGAIAGTFNRLTKEHGKEKAINIVEGYFNLSDQFIASQCHPVGMIERNINKILLAITSATEKPKSVFDKPNMRWID